MDLTTQEAQALFAVKKISTQKASVDFPLHGDDIILELETEDGRYKFQADINRKNRKSRDKITYQNRHMKVYIIRRLDFGSGHKNPPSNAPDERFRKYENVLINEPHVHFYFENFAQRWALPLTELDELDINLEKDDWYTVMEKFFLYCNIEGYTINKRLF